jgi:hypothetical protein
LLNKLEKRLKRAGDNITIDDLVDVIKIVGIFNRIVTKEAQNSSRIIWHVDLPKNKSFIEYEEKHAWKRESTSHKLCHFIDDQEICVGEERVVITPRLLSVTMNDEIMELIEFFLKHKDKLCEARNLIEAVEIMLKRMYLDEKERMNEFLLIMRNANGIYH